MDPRVVSVELEGDVCPGIRLIFITVPCFAEFDVKELS
jgi:hypothetical protein